ncbi:MutS protein msh5 [Podochytrium sp. JEL0797]|nr:MutS protein msh5 [Podochytrium sp. JEL0797]
MAYALRNSTRRSLILIDEYGKGTLHSDGVGLFCASIKHFLDRGAECPKVLATTHFQMDVFQGSLADEDRLTFLYRVVPGNSTSSLGLYCAKLAGISEAVLERANEIATAMESGIPLVGGRASKKATFRVQPRAHRHVEMQDVVEED